VVIGVTGKYCVGKNLVSDVLSSSGFHVIDVDRLGHTALIEQKEGVIQQFGPAIVGADGEIDRHALGRIVFADQHALRKLEETIHPAMIRAVRREIEREVGGNCVVNAAILFRMGLHALCDRVIWVEAPLGTRIRRALRRDALSLPQVIRRIWSQRKLSPQPFQNLVDIYNVRNSGNKKDLEASVLSLVKTG